MSATYLNTETAAVIMAATGQRPKIFYISDFEFVQWRFTDGTKLRAEAMAFYMGNSTQPAEAVTANRAWLDRRAERARE